MLLQILTAAAQGARLVARFVILLLVLSVLYDLAGRMSICFDPGLPFVLGSLPLCFLFSFGLLIEGLGDGGLSGLLWHYLPTIAVSLLITVIWAARDFRRRQT